LVDNQGTGTIINDDGSSSGSLGGIPSPRSGSTNVSINNVTTTEFNSGYKNFTFTVSLSSPASKSVAVKWATQGLTAKVGSDYLGANGTLTFSAGQTKKTITVRVISDMKVEANETFAVNLLSATNASIIDSQGKGTIINDDGRASGSL
jgi:hypothetical protein